MQPRFDCVDTAGAVLTRFVSASTITRQAGTLWEQCQYSAAAADAVLAALSSHCDLPRQHAGHRRPWQTCHMQAPFSFEESLITQYVTFKSSAAVSQDVSVVAGEARITLSGLPERGQHTAILTKLDEGNRGKGACLLPLIRAQPSLCKLTSFAPVGSLAVLGL